MISDVTQIWPSQTRFSDSILLLTDLTLCYFDCNNSDNSILLIRRHKTVSCQLISMEIILESIIIRLN